MSEHGTHWRAHPAFTALLGLDLLILLPQLQWQSALITLLLLLLWLWALAWRLGRLPAPNPWSKVALTLIIALAVFSRQAGSLGLQGGSTLLSVMLLMKTLEIRTARDFHAAIVALLFLLLSLLFRDDGWRMGLYTLALAMGVIWLLYLVALPERTVPALRPQLHHFVRPWRNLLMWALPLAIALFLLFPRLAQPLWGLPLDSSKGKTGLSEELRPGDLGELFLDDTPVFRASHFQPAMPPPEGLYWRAMVLWRYDGIAWKRAWLPVEVQPTSPENNALRYTLTNEAHAGNWRVSLDRPADSDYHARFTLDGQWISPQRWQPAGEHHLVSILSDRQPTAYPVALRWGLQLPPSGNPKTRIWAREQLKKAGNSAAFLQAMLDMFHQQAFYYSLSPPPLSDNPVDEFLFRTRTGYCEHYASALAFAMRAAGIPARVVTGYLGGEYNPLGQYIVVRKSDAHAWTEVWLKDQGWVRVDPTAAVAPERVQADIRNQQRAQQNLQASPALWLRQQLDWLAYRWNRWFLQYNHELQRSLLHRLSQWPRAVPLWVLGIFVLLPLGWLYHRWQRHDPLQRQWRRLQRKLLRTVPNAPVERGPEALALWAKTHLEEGEALARWIHHWLRLRYGKTGAGPLPALPPIRQARKPATGASREA